MAAATRSDLRDKPRWRRALPSPLALFVVAPLLAGCGLGAVALILLGLSAKEISRYHETDRDFVQKTKSLEGIRYERLKDGWVTDVFVVDREGKVVQQQGQHPSKKQQIGRAHV